MTSDNKTNLIYIKKSEESTMTKTTQSMFCGNDLTFSHLKKGQVQKSFLAIGEKENTNNHAIFYAETVFLQSQVSGPLLVVCSFGLRKSLKICHDLDIYMF